MQARETTTPPFHRRAGFEVAGWDGARWVLEGIFDSGAEASSQAKLVLARRQGVKVTEEVFNDAEGTFKSRVVFTEYRDPNAKPEPRKRADPATGVAGRIPRDIGTLDHPGKDAALYVAISSLLISIAAMLFALAR